MSDMHILQCDAAASGAARYQVAYHVPVASNLRDGTEARYPDDQTRTSEVTDLDETELAKLRSGEVAEFVRWEPFDSQTSVEQALAAIRQLWHQVDDQVGQEILRKYRLAGVELSRS